MIHQGLYTGRPALFQLFILLLFILAGAIVSSLIGMGIFYLCYGFTANISDYPDMMRMLQLISALGTFLLPALCTAWFCGLSVKDYLSIRKIPEGKILLLVLISMFLLSPTISLTGLWNKQMELPAFMAPVENWMRAQEQLAEQLTNILLTGKGPFTLMANLFVIAVAAGITEEFLFRGALQRIIGKWTPNHHIVIWTAAILFSAFHMQFFGFIPRMLLGAYFGYLLFWSKNIWIPVFAHFSNNAFAVIGMSNNTLKNNEYITGEIPDDHLLQFSLITLLTAILFFLTVRPLKALLQNKPK